jgi:SAM-dependent methyltransferase
MTAVVSPSGWRDAIAGSDDLQRPSAAGAAALAGLRERLTAAGVHEFCASFNPLSPALAPWAEHAERLPQPLRALVELLVLGREVDRPAVEAALGRVADELVELGLLGTAPDGRLSARGLVLRFVAGCWLLVDRPQANPVAYFGDDSVALLTRLAARPGGAALDLCSGPGLQALHLSSFAATVTAVEVHPAAAALSRVNAVLNGRHERIEVLCGDLGEPVRGRRFDTVVANPPLLPFPDDFPYPLVGHGGADGLRMTRRVLEQLPDLLAPGAAAQLIGTFVADRANPRAVAELETWCGRTGLDGLLTLVTFTPLVPGNALFQALAGSAALAAGRPREEAAAALAGSLREQAANALLAYYLLVTPGTGALRVVDLASPARRSMWHASGIARPDWL